MLALRGARFRVDHHIRRHDFADALLDGVAERVDLFEAGGARDADRGVDEMVVAGAANSHAVHIQNTVYARDRASDFFLQSFGRDIQQGVHSAFAEPRPYPQNNASDSQARESIGIDQPGHVPGFAGPYQPDASNYDQGAPDIG